MLNFYGYKTINGATTGTKIIQMAEKLVISITKNWYGLCHNG